MNQAAYRSPALCAGLAREIAGLADRPLTFMDVCGTHTMAIARHGLKSLLPPNVRLVSGPGCPVCVTAQGDLDYFQALAREPGVLVATFGDLLRVPGSRGSLAEARAAGAAVRVVASPFACLELAAAHPDRQVVFLGVGFETTAPTVAAALLTAQKKGLTNFSVLSAHKLLPPALAALLSGPDLRLSGFLCPGHVTTVIGTACYQPVAQERGLPCVVAGFEPADVLASILMLVKQVEQGRSEVEIQYKRAVRPEGNPAAVALMNRFFLPVDAPWRGLGLIPASGLALRPEYAHLDAAKRFDVAVPPAQDHPGCRCGEVLRGLMTPPECKLFAGVCNPSAPVGPCMVSAEGTCAAWYRYRRED